jgi:crotonobetainyl-CoA:carnitine CoA-transferase CaiB-like acyl-CoA transferase
LASVGFFQTLTHPTEGRIRYIGIPSRWNGSGLRITRHAPLLGEHSISVLSDAGVTAYEIEALLRSGATIDGATKSGGKAAPPERIAGKSPIS